VTHDITVLRTILMVVYIIAAVAASSFPILYSRTPWRRTPLGRVLMGVGASFAGAMDLTIVFTFWKPKNILIIFWVDIVVISAIAVSTATLTVYMWKMNHPKAWKAPTLSRKKLNIMQFSSGAYDVLKKIAMVWLPAAGTLYFALAQIWHLPSPEEVVGSIVAVDTFLGGVLHLSTTSYNNDPNRTAGTLELIPGEDGTNLRITSLDTQKLLTQPEVTFKMSGTPTQ